VYGCRHPPQLLSTLLSINSHHGIERRGHLTCLLI